MSARIDKSHGVKGRSDGPNEGEVDWQEGEGIIVGGRRNADTLETIEREVIEETVEDTGEGGSIEGKLMEEIPKFKKGNRVKIGIVILDVKTAYLQGDEIQREVYVKPPRKDGWRGLWKLKETVYGFKDAAKAWYCKVVKVVKELQVVVISFCYLQWQGHEKAYNNMLIVAALRLGIERLWVPDGYHPFLASEISELVSLVFPSDAMHFSLKELDQSEPSFDYFAKHAPNFEKIYVPRSDNVGFVKCCQFRNLRVIEFAGGVSDKVLCNALWCTGSRKSEKILDLALTKDHKSWSLTLPHLEVLENNIYRYDNLLSTMRVTLGAAAFAIQPKMAAVGSRLEWGTYEAILHLLDMEAKYKNGDVGTHQFM
ncbi:uncharacterized protein LOC135226012 [Macrobrachium nipponense]|uniref:uncharacterized protein LOC135226012 n=1 Tax=Macrobrachium nipponense TaxID=159736 RepID=UPI0030C81FF1